jgi:hypothetical protein
MSVAIQMSPATHPPAMILDKASPCSPPPGPERRGSSLRQPVAHQGIDAMVASAEAAQLDPLAVGNLLGVAVDPLDGHVAVGVGVDEHVEGAIAGELGEERDRRRDLSEDGGDLVLDFFLGLFLLGELLPLALRLAVWCDVFLVLGF